jgi:hypothetical protein
MNRRSFFTNSLLASTFIGLSCAGPASHREPAAGKTVAQEYYELRAYRLNAPQQMELLGNYLEKAAIPAWNRQHIGPVGVFTEKDSKEGLVVYVLLPHSTLESVAACTARLEADVEYQAAGQAYLQAKKDNPSFVRIDSWLLRAFAGIPRVELAPYCKERKERIFEMRTYESYSEAKALKKVEMFNSGEIGAMRETGLAPVFYGQALAGANLPHLVYMLSAENETLHKQHWDAFGKHPVWIKLRNDPQYADTVSKIVKRMLIPAAYSQI